MEGFLPVNLAPIPLAQLAANGANGQAPQGEGEAFQLLLESMLFENLAGQVFKGNGGVLGGTDLGLFLEEGQEGQKKGEDLLALLEMLQIPLLEQLRGPQNQGIFLGTGLGTQGELAADAGSLGNIAQLLTAGDDTEMPMIALTEEQSGFLETLGLELDGGGTNSETFLPGKDTTLFPTGQDLEDETINLSLEEEKLLGNPVGELNVNGKVTGEQPLPEASLGREVSSVNLMMEQTPKGLEPTTISKQFNEFTEATRGVGYTELADQLVQSGKLKYLGSKQEMDIQLKPEYLGKMAIRLTLENGAMTARFLVESHQVGRMLDSNLHNLKQTMEDQGVRFDQVEVEVGDPGRSFQERQQEWQHHGQASKDGIGEAIKNGEVTDAGQNINDNGSIDYHA